MPETKTF